MRAATWNACKPYLGVPIDMVSTGPDRVHHLAAPPVPRLKQASAFTSPTGVSSACSPTTANTSTSAGTSTMLTERLALKVHNSGWEFDPVLCLVRRHAAREMCSCVFDKPLAIMATSSYRADAGTIQGRGWTGPIHHAAQG